MCISIEREGRRQHMTTRIFALTTGCRATRQNNGLTFSLKELLPDDGGEVVIDNQTGTDVTVLTDDPVTDRGIEPDHITQAGHDVSGFAYCRFAGGITVFYPRSQSLCVNENELIV
jgi:hypothetical protein